MSIVLYHHPFSRAATVVWMLEELGLEHTLEFVDLKAGEQRTPAFRAINPMGKLPVLKDGDVVLTECAAIGAYLADRYSPGDLSPAFDDPARATWLRWILYAPSVIEPCAYARNAKWEYQEGAAGWGSWEAMHTTVEQAIGEGPYLLGERFSMADMVFGSTVRYMLRFGMMEQRTSLVDYVERLSARPASQRAEARNQAILVERGLA